MTKLKRNIICLTLLVFQLSCGLYDSERSESKQIIGKFHVVNLHLKEHPGYFLIFMQKNGNERIFLSKVEQIDYLKADNSMILIKTMPNPDVAYYLIEHANGDSVLSSRKLIDVEDFKVFELRLKGEKTFVAPRSETGSSQ